MTKREIIEETAAFYKIGNRAADEFKNCDYLGSGGKKCAVGRCVLDSRMGEVMAVGGSAVNLRKGFSDFDKIFKKKYRGHAPEFWNDLQALHDNEVYWNEFGLSHKGEIKKDALLKQYETN